MKLTLILCFLLLNTGCAIKTSKINTPKKYYSIVEFKNYLSPKLTGIRVLELFGPPESDSGSGLYILRYQVKEGGEITLNIGAFLLSATYTSPSEEEILFNINAENIDLNALRSALSAQKPSQMQFWSLLGEKIQDSNQHLIFKPLDKRFLRIEVDLDRTGGSDIESITIYVEKSNQLVVKDLEKKFGKSEELVIGPSDPGYQLCSFPHSDTGATPYKITVFGKITGYKITSDSPIIEVIFRRDKR